MKYDLHSHQKDALASLKTSLAAGNRRPMVMAPTGFGKTLLAAAIVEGALAKGNRVLFVVPFLSLIDQTVDAFAEQGIHSVGVIQGQHPLTNLHQPVQVASVQTLQRRRVPKADVVVIDEAHKWFRFVGEWMRRDEWQKVPFIGLSATPWTKGLGKHYDDMIIATTTADLISRRFLSPFKVFPPSHPDLSGVKTVAGDYHEGQLSEAMSQPVLIGEIVATWLRLGEDRPTLVFAVDRAHARKLTGEFERAGVPTGYVDMDTPRDEREQIGRRLREGQIRVVVNVYTLTTGIDWDIRCIVLARPTKSEMLFVQIIGRGLRTAKDKTECLVLDHSDTTLRLGFVSDIQHDKLDDGTHQASSTKRREKGPSLPKECPTCSFLKPAGIRRCPSCGFEPERQSMIEETSGNLVQLNGKHKGKAEATPHSRQEVWSMLLWYQQEHDKNPKFAVAKYKARYGVWPRGLHEAPMEPDTAFLNWMKSETIRWAKSRNRREKEARHTA